MIVGECDRITCDVLPQDLSTRFLLIQNTPWSVHFFWLFASHLLIFGIASSSFCRSLSLSVYIYVYKYISHIYCAKPRILHVHFWSAGLLLPSMGHDPGFVGRSQGERTELLSSNRTCAAWTAGKAQSHATAKRCPKQTNQTTETKWNKQITHWFCMLKHTLLGLNHNCQVHTKKDSC